MADNTKYWEKMRTLVNSWSRYNTAKKLYVNACYEETRFKVEHIVNQYFGNISNLASEVSDRKIEVLRAINEFNHACTEVGFEVFDQFDSVSNETSLNWLFNHLKDADDYKSIRRKIDRRINKNAAPESIADLVPRY